ncbi:M20/M25/M40 family metallo-hydrolase [Williamwhitmania taraxaci]|uniref:Zn-dependent amino-or carboxypeptidase, M28 family n=1 Tax=Williamwhitmania taraxaci TaxID=1640674 RepID=A0A1G6GNI5_9BACT|nr:M20/M25/M40 family metallo-hydrolase [Williamwhitmania taraxaci]SDB83560.1 Zn-dependent amino-or carboxypeptidase, M28 family [Williamwhitmania taraxaci]
MSRSLILLLLPLALVTQSCKTSEITIPDLRNHVQFLASDNLKGREPGTVEDRLAAKYIKDALQDDGLTMLGERGYQFFTFVKEQKLGQCSFALEQQGSLELGKEFTLFPFSGTDSLSAEAVFVGFGIASNSPTFTWDDYQTVTVTGKWVLILRGNPGTDTTGNPFEQYTGDRIKALTAKEHGAKGVIMVSGVSFDKDDALVDPLTKDYSIDIPVIQVTRSVANSILSKSSKTIEALESEIRLKQERNSFEINSTISAKAELKSIKEKTQNVVAILEGCDPLLKNEIVIIGGHFDHLGMGGPNSSSRKQDTVAVHNGADDNASGVAAMLEIAQKMAKQRKHIKRSVVFLAFAGEELGLLGSKYFVNTPIVDISKSQAMINLDMVGRMSPEKMLQIGGVGTSDNGLSILLATANPDSLKLATSPEGYGPSDHASFYGKNIPVFFFSTGAHLDYHTPFDDVERINFNGLKSITEFTYNLALSLANAPSKLSFKEAGPKVSNYSRSKRFKVTLGIMPDVSGQQNNGLRADFVTAGKPAARGGMLNGDTIISIDGKAVNNIQDYMVRLGGLKEGQTISVEVIRNSERKILIIKL